MDLSLNDAGSSFDNLSDEELAALCRNDPDNMDPMSALIKRYMPLIRKSAARFSSGGIPADDLSQEAVLAFIKAAEKYDPERNKGFSSFIYSCINNRMISVIRKYSAHNSEEQLCDELPAADSLSDPEVIFIERELYSEMFSLLSPLELDIFRCCLDGGSYREIADELGISVKSVDNGVRRIRRKLRAALSEDEP